MFNQLPDEPAGRDYVFRPHPDADAAWGPQLGGVGAVGGVGGACGPQPGGDGAVSGARPRVPLRRVQIGTFNFVLFIKVTNSLRLEK